MHVNVPLRVDEHVHECTHAVTHGCTHGIHHHPNEWGLLLAAHPPLPRLVTRPSGSLPDAVRAPVVVVPAYLPASPPPQAAAKAMSLPKHTGPARTAPQRVPRLLGWIGPPVTDQSAELAHYLKFLKVIFLKSMKDSISTFY